VDTKRIRRDAGKVTDLGSVAGVDRDSAPVADGLDRRFEAVVLVSDDVIGRAEVAPLIQAFRKTGGAVGVVSLSPLEQLVKLLAAAPASGELLLAGAGGARRAVITPVIEIDDPAGPSGITEAAPQLARDVDATRWIMARLWEYGIGPSATLLVCAAENVRNRLDHLLGPEAAGVTVAVMGGPDDTKPSSGTMQFVSLLTDQVRRRERGELPSAVAERGWRFAVDQFDPELERVNGALLSLGDGYIGTSGAPLVADPNTHPWALAIGVYDGEGPDTRLLTGPVAFRLPFDLTPEALLRRVLDLRTGVLYEDAAATSAGPVRSARFVSLAQPATLAFRARCSSDVGVPTRLEPPSDDPVYDEGEERDFAWMRVAGSPGSTVAAAGTAGIAREAAAGQIIERLAAYQGSPEGLPDPREVLGRAATAAGVGFDRLLAEHRRAWAARWADGDVTVEGDDELQLAIRFALFHLFASVPDSGEAAVGARGLTGRGYRGHVFWDADTFVLPCMAATHPASARAMLEYRIRRLPAAIDAARAAGHSGARFPWESAHSGRDVTPTFARDRTGNTVSIRTGQLEEHIVADVAWAASHYADWTGDEEFIRGPGLRLLVETARYWASRIRLASDGTAHLYGVIGPDEYHEPVDDNAYTNVMARWNLRRAADVVEASGSSAATTDEVRQWRVLASALVDGYDANTGVYEQFAGFGRLDPLIIAEVAPRRPIAADLLLGADRVRASQVIKQADVLMLHHLVPDEIAPDSLVPNLEFYEPRTAHGSSLSPAIHASLFARARDFRRALDALHIASRIDLDDLTATTASGLHLATMGGLWQALVFGFAGLRPTAGRLRLDPHLPPAWGALDVRVRFHGARVRVHCEKDSLSIDAEAPVDITVGGAPFVADQQGLRLRRISAEWRVE
jgi:trehalose/maltose hydrolase-like predicted phosphorylase